MATQSSLRGPSLLTVPEGDTRERRVCPDCGFVAYENPKIVVGSVVVSGDRFLLCRRAIEPRRGYWTLPAGYLEVNESTMAGAAREALEEAPLDFGRFVADFSATLGDAVTKRSTLQPVRSP